jgi:hypothetical protein
MITKKNTKVQVFVPFLLKKVMWYNNIYKKRTYQELGVTDEDKNLFQK